VGKGALFARRAHRLRLGGHAEPVIGPAERPEPVGFAHPTAPSNRARKVGGGKMGMLCARIEHG